VEKGYGFITRDDGAEDVFVHISALERSGLTGLSEGDRVILDIAERRKKG
jgi:CspA family cold shock protein